MKKLIAILIVIGNCLLTTGQSEIQWQKSFGGSSFDQAYAVDQTTDGGYIVVGSTTSSDGDASANPPDTRSVWVLRLDQNGDTLWTRALQESTYAYSVKQTADEGFILGCSEFTLVKLSPEGSVSWSTSLGVNSFLDRAFSVNLTDDGGYIAGGELLGGWDGMGNYSWFIARYNQSGDTVWTRCFEDFFPGRCYSIEETTDGHFIASGSKEFYTEIEPGVSEINEQFAVMKLSSTGDTAWTYLSGGEGNDIAYSVLEAPGGGYMSAGTCASGELTGREEDGWIIKLDENGNAEWKKFIGGSYWDEIHSMDRSGENGYFLCGFTGSDDGDLSYYEYMTPNYWLVKINNNGDVLLSESYGGDNQDYGQNVTGTADGGCIVVGKSWSENGAVSENKGYEDIWILKLGSTSSAIDEPPALDDIISIWPNPADDLLIIENTSEEIKYISIVTMEGRTLSRISLEMGTNEIDLSDYEPGVYLVGISYSQTTWLKKIIKL